MHSRRIRRNRQSPSTTRKQWPSLATLTRRWRTANSWKSGKWNLRFFFFPLAHFSVQSDKKKVENKIINSHPSVSCAQETATNKKPKGIYSEGHPTLNLIRLTFIYLLFSELVHEMRSAIRVRLSSSTCLFFFLSFFFLAFHRKLSPLRWPLVFSKIVRPRACTFYS